MGLNPAAEHRKKIGKANRKEVRWLMRTCLGITQREIAERLGLSVMAVNRHYNDIRKEWQFDVREHAADR